MENKKIENATKELTTEELCNALKKITGNTPYLIKHYLGRREGDFYDSPILWDSSVRSGTYLINDKGEVKIK